MSASAPGIQADATQNLWDLLADRHTWEKYTLYGESIPHLLHWDWAYLWLLARESVQPDSWRDRIEAWRRLLCMLLLSELEIDAQPIRQPLLSYTSAINLTEVVFVRAPQFFKEAPIGVFSPTVLVRPLPEPNRFGIAVERLAAELPKHYDPPPSSKDDRRAELAQMLDLAKKTIADSSSTFAPKLLAVLDRNLTISRFTPTSTHFDALPLSCSIPLLPAADATAWNGMQLSRLPLQVSTKGGRPRYVPRCSQANCRTPLTYAISEPAIDALAVVRLKCRSCQTETTIPLAAFGIWQHQNTYYVWTGIHELPERPLVPPTPELMDEEIHFRWNPISLGGETSRVHLRLRFPNHQVKSVNVADIRYGSLLIPGEFGDRATGYPIRPEWLFAVEKMPDMEISGEVLAFRRMKLRGLNDEVTLGRYPRAACTIAPDLQVGMFPGPMYPGWLRYRFYWSGAEAGRYRACVVPDLAKRDVKETVSNVGIVEWNAEIPQAITIETQTQGGSPAPTGATWRIEAPQAPTSTQPISLGIDFGTTNTVIYTSSGSALEPIGLSDFASAGHVIAGTPGPRASFLPPGSGNVAEDMDASLIPSTLWAAKDNPYSPIRWATEPPSTINAYAARAGFKWDKNTQVYRARYLDELLFLVLPVALRKLFPHDATRANWNLGFAFPLAFPHPLRNDYKTLFSNAARDVGRYSSGGVTFSTTSESYACVRAFGSHGEDVFIIADLGGGSLDVALFEIASGGNEGEGTIKHIQVGSAEIGGEVFLRAISEKAAVDPQGKDRQYWRIRDAMMTGRMASEFPQKGFGVSATRFLLIAQELLRTMVAAFRVAEPNRRVQLVLAGNGWRIEEFKGSAPLARSVARKELESSFAKFGINAFSVYPDDPRIPPKHMVARGALKHIQDGGQSEIDKPFSDSRMPSGRTIRIQASGQTVGTIQWSDLVGPDVTSLPLGFGKVNVEIDRDLGPPTLKEWQQNLDYALPNMNSVPDSPEVRDSLGVSGQRLEKGPLQVILEKRAEDLQ